MTDPDDDEKTRIIRRPDPEEEVDTEEVDPGITSATRMLQPTPEESEMTRLVGPPRRSARGETAGSEEGGEHDPVVGWVVVTAGPGRGKARRLGYGQNSIGRDKTERVALDFGDAGISRSKHCFILYDPRKRQYLLRPGEGTNLTYLDGEVLADSRILKVGQTIEVGDTSLRFVPLCGPDFDWQQDSPALSK